MHKRKGIRAGILGLFIAAAVLSPGVAAAEDIKVTTPQDGDDKECAEHCTLREAVTFAGSDDRVLLPANTYRLTMGELVLVADEIVGDGARSTLIDGGGNSRVMRVADGGSRVSGVTIARGNGGSEFANGFGGGVYVQGGGAFQLSNSTVRDNVGERGGGIAADGPLTLIASTVSNNTASSVRPTLGGGVLSTAFLAMVNSTVSGNKVTDGSEGGGVASTGQFSIDHSTIADNTGAGLFVQVPQQGGALLITNSVLDGGTGGACAGPGIGALIALNNIADDASCQLKDPSNRNNANTALGPLADNGGQTDTHALLPASAAINAAGGCQQTDQRGVTRPQTGSTCDSGAYEYRAPTLQVTMAVTNDDGGPREPSDFTVHVLTGGDDVKGSPQAGDPRGTTYVLDAGTAYEVSADDVAGYALTLSGDCKVTLQEGQNGACTITANDLAPTLRVITTVANDNGGTLAPGGADVHVRLRGTDVDGSPAPGLPGPTGRFYTLDAGGPYVVSVDEVTGYTASLSGTCSVTLALDQDEACTVTLNDVAPTLRVITNVTNDDGGTLEPSGALVHVRRNGVELTNSPAPGVGLPNGRLHETSTGAHAVSVDPVNGYASSRSAGCEVTLSLDQDVTCTVTLNDIAPTLNVVTVVKNDDGGDATAADFSAHVRRDGAEVDGSPEQGTGAPGTRYTLDAGSYTVTADGVRGYAPTGSGACNAAGTISLALAENATCTITVDDGAAELTVVTEVINDYGGMAGPRDFSVSVLRDGEEIAGGPGNAAGTPYALSAGSYTVLASTVPGYVTTLSGDCAVVLALEERKVCTITARDIVPRLTVVTQVVNDHGGTATPAGFTVRVRKGAADVGGSPQPGNGGGTVYALPAGSHTVSADAVSGYTTAVSGDCAADGSVTLGVGDDRTCTVTANDHAPPLRGQDTGQDEPQELPPPEPGKTVNALPKSGAVKVKAPGAKAYVALKEGQQLPVGTLVDARKGHVTLVAAANRSGGTATAEFWAGIFRLGQTKGARPITTLKLVEKLSCPKRGKASASAKKKKRKKRRLWGNGKGRFRTDGKYSSATVRGTKWLVEDRCTSTLTRVVRGRVTVRDRVKKKNVSVRARKKYVAKAKR